MADHIFKKKYIELRSKYIEAVDTAFRVGYEQGLQKGQMDAQNQQMQIQQQQAAQQAQMMQQGQGAQPGAEQQPGMEGQMPQEEMEGQMPQEEMGGQMSPEEQEQMSQPGELDGKIAELEDLLQRGEKPKILDLRKAVNELSLLRKKQLTELNKNNKKVETAQRSLVKNILNKWQEESKSVTSDLDQLLSDEGIKL